MHGTIPHDASGVLKKFYCQEYEQDYPSSLEDRKKVWDSLNEHEEVVCNTGDFPWSQAITDLEMWMEATADPGTREE